MFLRTYQANHFQTYLVKRVSESRYLVALIPLSYNLLGNPKGPVEQGNQNTCTEVKLYLFFYFGSRNSLPC